MVNFTACNQFGIIILCIYRIKALSDRLLLRLVILKHTILVNHLGVGYPNENGSSGY